MTEGMHENTERKDAGRERAQSDDFDGEALFSKRAGLLSDRQNRVFYIDKVRSLFTGSEQRDLRLLHEGDCKRAPENSELAKNGEVLIGAIKELDKLARGLLPKQRSGGRYSYGRSDLGKLKEELPQLTKSVNENLRLAIDAAKVLTVADLGSAEFRDKGILTAARYADDFRHIATVSIRDYPQGSLCDTMMFRPDMEGRSPYKNDATGTLFFQNDEIYSVDTRYVGAVMHKVSDRDGHGEVPYAVDSDGRAVIQQYGMRGCGAAALAMMQIDNGVSPSLRNLLDTNLSHLDSLTETLRRNGLSAVYEMIPLYQLHDKHEWWNRVENIIEEHGSAMCSISGEIGGHLIVVDKFSLDDDYAKVRDPYHGWSIELSAKSLVERGMQSICYVKG